MPTSSKRYGAGLWLVASTKPIGWLLWLAWFDDMDVPVFMTNCFDLL